MKSLNAIAVGDIKPDLTLLYDVSTETAMNRVGAEKDRMESAGMEFHKAVRDGYLFLQKQEPERIKLIEANKSIEEVFSSTKQFVEKLIEEKLGD